MHRTRRSVAFASLAAVGLLAVSGQTAAAQAPQSTAEQLGSALSPLLDPAVFAEVMPKVVAALTGSPIPSQTCADPRPAADQLETLRRVLPPALFGSVVGSWAGCPGDDGSFEIGSAGRFGSASPLGSIGALGVIGSVGALGSAGAAVGAGSAGSAAIGSAAVGSAALGSAVIGGAGAGSAGLGSSGLGSSGWGSSGLGSSDAGSSGSGGSSGGGNTSTTLSISAKRSGVWATKVGAGDTWSGDVEVSVRAGTDIANWVVTTTMSGLRGTDGTALRTRPTYRANEPGCRPIDSDEEAGTVDAFASSSNPGTTATTLARGTGNCRASWTASLDVPVAQNAAAQRYDAILTHSIA